MLPEGPVCFRLTCGRLRMFSELLLLPLIALLPFSSHLHLLQRASFSMRVSVMKAKNLMAKDANGEKPSSCSFSSSNP